ncbi:MFS dicarboxylate transporter [Sphaerisporangium krabiense]|uniref:Putative proline/betaine transporter n=1 Tax=Sphaerisporangium krabiense TaxID=763782 RepID=A0A7W9DQZ9_9ACTN|nr:MFS transporter [Sphaerisporangium krabiense]MBB5628102.1 MHS family alpha-ketoglutarate permease-like MFS transporter [Sphaerisporangium krabiense]GII62269.1 MFS dicarboxylate transporter [Sphaerisporangium krabiense]
MVEWYDWFAYASFATYFAASFFPKGNATAQLLNAAGVFAVGFFMRPVGGWLLGRYADRKGRKAALALTVTMMSVSALLIAVAPTYAQVGYFGAAVLVAARLLQGLSVGGEYAASATYLTEASHPRRRGFSSSFQYVSMTAGQLVGLGLQMLLQRTMSDAALHAWGWRVPFVVGAAGAAVVFYIRRGLLETAAYEEEAADERRGTVRLLLEHKREAALVMALTMGGTLAYYTYTTYLTKYLSNTAGLSKADATLVGFLALSAFCLLQPLAGALSDRVGRRPLLIMFGVGGTLGTVPLLTALRGVTTVGAALALSLVALVIVTGYTSVNACVKAELFPTRVRALGVALPFALANAVFGGTAEYVALWFKNAGAESGFYWYVAGCAAVSLTVYVTMRETRDATLSGADRDEGVTQPA